MNEDRIVVDQLRECIRHLTMRDENKDYLALKRECFSLLRERLLELQRALAPLSPRAIGVDVQGLYAECRKWSEVFHQ